MEPGNPEGVSHVRNNCISIDSSVGTRAGEQLHHGWVHPCFSRARTYRVPGKHHSGTQNRVE
jgi:hypothetical protein